MSKEVCYWFGEEVQHVWLLEGTHNNQLWYVVLELVQFQLCWLDMHRMDKKFGWDKSNSENCFSFESSVVIWSSKKQEIVALSSSKQNMLQKVQQQGKFCG